MGWDTVDKPLSRQGRWGARLQRRRDGYSRWSPSPWPWSRYAIRKIGDVEVMRTPWLPKYQSIDIPGQTVLLFPAPIGSSWRHNAAADLAALPTTADAWISRFDWSHTCRSCSGCMQNSLGTSALSYRCFMVLLDKAVSVALSHAICVAESIDRIRGCSQWAVLWRSIECSSLKIFWRPAVSLWDMALSATVLGPSSSLMRCYHRSLNDPHRDSHAILSTPTTITPGLCCCGPNRNRGSSSE